MIKKILIIITILFSSSVFADGIRLKQHFFGVKGELLNNIVERTKLPEQEINKNLSLQEVRSLQEQNSIEIKDSLAAYGYFKPEIKATIKRGATWIIDYHINPGNVLRITHLDIQLTGEGLRDRAFFNLMPTLPLQEGDPVRSKYYQEAKSLLVDLAAQRGYFSAKIEQSNILIDLKNYEATVIIHFNTGPRYYFGEVEFSPSPYSSRFLQRFVPFKTNQPYQNKKIVRLQENLGNSNFFQQVIVTPEPENAYDLRVPVRVDVVPRKAIQYTVGAGFGTDTGIRGLAGIQLRRINGSGHHAEALIQASQRLNHVEASYIIPGCNPVTDLYKLSVAAEKLVLPTNGTTRNEKIELSYVSTVCCWQQTLSISLRDEHSQPTEGPILNSTMLLPNLNWSKVKSDDPLSPNWGYQISLNLRGATKALISNTDFIQGLLQAKGLIPISSVTRVVLKGQIGFTIIPDVDELPISLQFYTGGAQTVRGYQFEEIGPGRTLLMGSVELQQKIKGNLYGAIFFDAGNVSNDLVNNLRKSIGVGLLWRSPIGAIEITLAQALDNPGHPRLLQFSMGPEL